jgi:hypothetical protein
LSIAVAGATVTYNALTGSHYGWTAADQPIERIALVRMSGQNRRLRGDLEGEVIYGVEPTARASDQACLGACLAPEDSSLPSGVENPHRIRAVGNGEMWVTDGGSGDIQPGDFLFSIRRDGLRHEG